jgi:dipeptidase E
MINAVLYSDQIIPANSKVDLRLLEMIKHRGNRIGYVPSGPDPGGRFFNEKKAYYARYDLQLPIVYDLDQEHGHAELDDLLACDAIHLAGGDTTAFLGRMRRSGMLDILRRWGESGGMLIGTSAGAIVMTPTIAVDALFSGQRPEDVNEGAALDLLPFEFFPHIQAKPSYLAGLLRYSALAAGRIIACPDGDGVIVTNGKVECIGDPLWISNGSVDRVTQITLTELAASRR